MRIFNENKTAEIINFDLEKGHLKDDVLITIKESMPASQEQGHIEFLREYKNDKGETTGKDYKWVVDFPGKVANSFEKIVEYIKVYTPYTSEELQCREQELRQKEIERQMSVEKVITTNPIHDIWMQYEEIVDWFKDYDVQMIEYGRCLRLGKPYDRNIQELDKIAEKNAMQLNRLKAQIEGGIK